MIFPTQAEIDAARRSQTKLLALKRDLEKLLAEDRAMHAVVFTQHPAAHAAIVEMCQDIGAEIFSVSGKDKFEKRHQAIRDFQAGCDTVDGGGDAGGAGGSSGAGGTGGSSGAGGAGGAAGGGADPVDDWVQCERCDAWHKVPNDVSADLPEVWTCQDDKWGGATECQGGGEAAGHIAPSTAVSMEDDGDSVVVASSLTSLPLFPPITD